MADTIEQALTRTRDGYAKERRWHRFLFDAYTGGGGFAGRIGCPDSELGSACAVYPPVETTYLDRYGREDEAKFARRVLVAHYVNYVEGLTDLKCGFALDKPYTVEGLPKEVEDWKANVDGKGGSFDEARSRLVRRAAIVGWAPTIIDTPATPEGVRTLAQARDAKIAPRLIGLYPANLTEWLISEGVLKWVKVRNDFAERETFMSDEKKFSVIDVWETTQVTRYRLADGKLEGAGEPIARPNALDIPLTVLRHKEAEDDPMIGLPMNGQVAIEARRLFNLMSALDEALDASCFPLLVMVDSLGEFSDSPEGGEVTVGANNALSLPPDSSQKHYYLAPPAEVFDAFEKRISETVREMFRMGRVEFVRPNGSQNESGLARKHAFQQTNSAVASFAKRIAAWEQATYVQAGRALGVAEDALKKIRVVPPEDFDIEDIEGALKRLELAFTLKLGSLFNAIMKKRMVQEMAPNLSPADRKKIDAEIDDIANEDASAGAFARSGGADPADLFADPTVDPGADPAAPPAPKPKPPIPQPA